MAASVVEFFVSLLDEGQIRYDGILQRGKEVFEIQGRDKYTKSEYANLIFSTCVYPIVPLILILILAIGKDSGSKDFCYGGTSIVYYVFMALELPWIVSHILLFIATYQKKNECSHRSMNYSQAGGIWVEAEKPLGYISVQFFKDVLKGVFGHLSSNLDLFSDLMTLFTIAKVYQLLHEADVKSNAMKNAETSLIIIMAIMSFSVSIGVARRLLAIIYIKKLLWLDKERLHQHCKYAEKAYDVLGLDTTMFDRFGANVVMEKTPPFSQKLREGDWPLMLNINQVMSRFFLFAGNSFLPLLYPPETDTLTEEMVKEDLMTKMRSSTLKVFLESIPQGICQIYFTYVFRDICDDGDLSLVYISITASLIVGIALFFKSLLSYFDYKNIESKIFLNKHIIGQPRHMIAARELSHKNFIVMAEYWLKNPDAIQKLNLDKGKIHGYDPKLKIKVPKHVQSQEATIRINFCQSYVELEDPKDVQIVIDFLQAFSSWKITFIKGFMGMPKELEEAIANMENVTVGSGF